MILFSDIYGMKTDLAVYAPEATPQSIDAPMDQRGSLKTMIAHARANSRETTASVATKPFIHLSAGVAAAAFHETLEMAAGAGAPFAGVLRGRAILQRSVPVYVRRASDDLMAHVSEDGGTRNSTALNQPAARWAQPCWTVYGGKDDIRGGEVDQKLTTPRCATGRRPRSAEKQAPLPARPSLVTFVTVG